MRKSISLIAMTLLLCALAACSTVSPRRGFNRAMIDRNIQITAQHALDTDPQLQGRVHIGTSVYNGVLLMIGEASTEADKARAEADVTGYESVRKIVNLVDVMPPASVPRNALDAALTASVKTSLLGVGLPGFDPGRVKVSTAHGNVYLMGLLTHAEAAAVTAKVSHVAGVQKVVPVFEYTD
ncbi:MAG TPA: BON domain-containing protein [Rhodanobacteraceae bacterium]|jgi:osmotically-inducible protein OsmY|nr:BON domain-containing protein [Rhodanobacteraceae bacterium]